MGVGALFGLLFLIAWVVFLFWLFKRFISWVIGVGGSLFSGSRARGEIGRNWDADEYERLADLDSERQDLLPPSLDDLAGNLEDSVREERENADEIRAAIAQRKDAMAKLDRAAAEWRERAELAVAKGRDDLARKALIEVQECEEAKRGCERVIGELQPILASYEAEIAQLQRRLNDKRARRLIAEARLERARDGQRAGRLLRGDQSNDLDNALYALDRRADEQEGAWEAERLGRDVDADDTPTNSLALPSGSDQAIEDQLNSLKARRDRDQV